MTNLFARYLPFLVWSLFASSFLLSYFGVNDKIVMAIAFMHLGAAFVLRSLVSNNFLALMGSLVGTLGAVQLVLGLASHTNPIWLVGLGGGMLSIGIRLERQRLCVNVK